MAVVAFMDTAWGIEANVKAADTTLAGAFPRATFAMESVPLLRLLDLRYQFRDGWDMRSLVCVVVDVTKGSDVGSRKVFKLCVWIALTVFVMFILLTGSRGIVRVLCGVVVAAFGTFTIALMLAGRNPSWTYTPQERRTIKKRQKAG